MAAIELAASTPPRTIVRRITGLNRTALAQVQRRDLVPSLSNLGATVATFDATPADAAAEVQAAITAIAAEFGSRCTTCRSLHAVLRKLKAQVV